MKTRVLSLTLAVIITLSLTLLFTSNTFAAEGWDGKTCDIGWYVNATDQKYNISTPEEFAGLAVLVFAAGGNSLAGNKVFYDANYKLFLDDYLTKNATEFLAMPGYTQERSIAGSKFIDLRVNLLADLDLNGQN